MATAAVLAVALQVDWVGFGELGRVGWERPFVVAEVLEGRTAVSVPPLPGKVNSEVVGQVVRPEQRFCHLRRGLVGKGFGNCERVCRERPVLSTRVMEGERPFYVKLSGNSQRHFQCSQSDSAQRFNNFAQASRPRRWSGVPPNTGSR